MLLGESMLVVPRPCSGVGGMGAFVGPGWASGRVGLSWDM